MHNVKCHIINKISKFHGALTYFTKKFNDNIMQGGHKKYFIASAFIASVLFNWSRWDLKYSFSEVCIRHSVKEDRVAPTVMVIVTETRNFRIETLISPIAKCSMHVKTLNFKSDDSSILDVIKGREQWEFLSFPLSNTRTRIWNRMTLEKSGTEFGMRSKDFTIFPALN